MSDDLSIPSPTYRVPRRSPGMDPGTRRLALIAGCLGGVLLVVVGVWTVMGRHSGTVPVLQADDRPIRVKPENPGGLQVAGANNELLSGGNDTDGGKLAPPPEAPAPQALRAPPAPPPAVAPAPTPAAPVATPLAPPAPKPVAPPAKAAASAATDKAAPTAAPDKPAAATASARPAPSGKTTVVQLAAVGTEDAAKSEWRRLEKRMPDLLGHREPTFSKTEHDGRTFWRLRTGGFSDTAQATQFCERVRAKGGSCSVADF